MYFYIALEEPLISMTSMVQYIGTRSRTLSLLKSLLDLSSFSININLSQLTYPQQYQPHCSTTRCTSCFFFIIYYWWKVTRGAMRDNYYCTFLKLMVPPMWCTLVILPEHVSGLIQTFQGNRVISPRCTLAARVKVASQLVWVSVQVAICLCANWALHVSF